MTNGELIEMLIQHAKEFQSDETFFSRNEHMFSTALGTAQLLTPTAKAVVLTGFLNHVASKHCMDLGMYLEDFLTEVESK